MKTKHILYPLTLMIVIILPVIRYYITTPWVNSCVLDYVNELENSNFSGYLYNINGMRHIEPKNSPLAPSLKEYQVGVANGCIMASDNLYIDLTNTFYCTITYLIKKAPIHESMKEPFWVYEWNDINKN